ncbi:MAG: heme exporter protein CcmD [Rhodobacteraceae bacterium]|nr:heme exporter protein CcmD [Paracoccaceae bacterium]MCY4249904.1 heme exporter protein CcmD [Paracoccaceae bacterium]
MPDLGAYSFFVLSSYGMAILVLLGLCILTVSQYRSAKRKLAKLNGN